MTKSGVWGIDCSEIQGRRGIPASGCSGSFHFDTRTPVEADAVTLPESEQISKMADKGGTENKEEVLPIDSARDYEEEKIRMRTAKTLMTKKVK